MHHDTVGLTDTNEDFRMKSGSPLIQAPRQSDCTPLLGPLQPLNHKPTRFADTQGLNTARLHSPAAVRGLVVQLCVQTDHRP